MREAYKVHKIYKIKGHKIKGRSASMRRTTFGTTFATGFATSAAFPATVVARAKLTRVGGRA